MGHYDFIIGRGHKYPVGCMNFPLNPYFRNRNIIYIDPNSAMDADIQQPLQDVDFSVFDIRDEKIRFIFDYSSFYCSAIQTLTDTMIKLNKPCQVYVPLYKEEKQIPLDIIRTLTNKMYTLSTTEGKYILFDWSQNDVLPENMRMKTHLNSERYVRIDVDMNILLHA